MEKRTIIQVAEGSFPFQFFIKAQVGEELGKMVVEGIASTPNVDHDKERMAPEALKSMARIINTTGVPLRVEHSQKDNAIIGNVNKAWVDDRNQLWIKATLDESHPAAGILYKGLKDGVKMGLSVGGYVKRAVQEMVEGLGKSVNTFYDVLLDEVSVTQKPSNYDARLMAKSFAKSEGEVDALAGVFESSEFLFNSALEQGDYIQAFAKSIPAEAWKATDKDYKLDLIKTMESKDKDEKEVTKAEDDKTEEVTKTSDKESEEKTEKGGPSRSEFNDLVKAVGNLGNAMTSVLGKMAKAMGEDAMDQNHPDKKKIDPEEGKAVDKSQGGEAVDQEQPKKNKKDPEEGKGVMGKSADGDGEGDGSDLDGKREKAAKDDTYDLETVERAIKAIQAVGKSVDETKEDKTEKASGDESDRTEKSVKPIASIDRFVIEVATAIERIEKSMKEGGFQTEHIAKAVINQIRSNPEYQKDIAGMMSEVGPKRSVINGTPFVKMKGGQMFKLTLDSNEANTRTEKSVKEVPAGPGAFKKMWGSSFSSTPSQEE